MGSVAVRNIRSFIIIDLETTGLPICDRKVRITEMVMIGTLREHIIECNANAGGANLPRVLPKLNLYTYPKKAVSPASTDLTGLSNELLENMNPFDDFLVNMVDGFIQRLPPPVCLIAHNGNKFDFPILQAELHNIGKALPDDLLCADSLPALREILQSKASERCNRDKESYEVVKGIRPLENCDEVDRGRSLKHRQFEIEGLDGDGYDEALYKMAESVEKLDQKLLLHNDKNCSSKNNSSSHINATLCEQNLTNQVSSLSSKYTETDQQYMQMLQKQLETTPKQTIRVQSSIPVHSTANLSSKYTETDQQYMQMLQKQLETTPKQTIRVQSSIPVHSTANMSPHVTPTSNNRKDQQFSRNPRAKKQLFPSEKKLNGSVPKSFKLVDVYQFLCSKEAVDAHHAESDCLNLLECIVATAPQFLEWTDKNAVEFKELKKMW